MLEVVAFIEEVALELTVDKSYYTVVESIPWRASVGTSVAASSYSGSIVECSSLLSLASDLDVVLVVPHVVNSSSPVVSPPAGHLASWDGSVGSCGCFSVDITFVSVVAVVSS